MAHARELAIKNSWGVPHTVRNPTKTQTFPFATFEGVADGRLPPGALEIGDTGLGFPPGEGDVPTAVFVRSLA